MRRLIPRRTSGLVGSLVVVGLLAACAQVPHQGPVVEASNNVEPPPPQVQYNNPKGPQPGATAADIVTGFLVAMTATPLQTTTAQKFLSNQARAEWQPERVVTYNDHTLARGTEHVVVRLRGADQVGVRGEWRGPVPAEDRRIVFPMVRESDEWRIARAPDALIVPRTFFDQQYQSAQVYFFDPTGRILVPEPVHVPQGSQLASALVRALVRGPSPSLSAVSRSFLPHGLTPGVLPVGRDGVADVTLKGPDPGPLGDTTQQILAQLAWTLRQDPEIKAFTLSIAGRAVADASGTSPVRVDSDEFDRVDPGVDSASAYVYALRRGRLVSGQIVRPTPVDGPFGRADLGIGPFAVRLDGNEVAGVTDRSLLVGPVTGTGRATEALSGTGLLRPAWDFADRLWDVQDGTGGSIVVYLADGRRHQVTVPGITGEDVRRFLVSRDGSRIVAVLRGPNADRIVAARLQYDADGRALGATRTHVIRWVSSGTTRIRDIGWTSPTTIAVLDQLSPSRAEVRVLSVDGSTPPDQAAPTQVSGRVSGLVASPVDKPYAVGRSGLIDISPVDLNKLIPIDHLHHLTYAG
ncbi:MAG TPA: LpqB family beta-propeller domain-containing protein [Nocardioides sp.]|uniref:LpqB family beta-propeller domain-containing protein n=1 Tax=Nocardioides sp. TaxID=35761 RepID=UPI002F418890